MKNPIKFSQSIAGVAVIFVLAFNAQASEIPGTPSQKAEAALEAPKVEDRSADWHLQNWPVDESHRQYNQDLQQTKNGKHIWRNGKGGIVAGIEIKDSQPFEGLTYIQGASDYQPPFPRPPVFAEAVFHFEDAGRPSVRCSGLRRTQTPFSTH